MAIKNPAIEKVQKVSVHGGHSGQFCHHAKDSLEEVIRAYVDQGFTWVGITEHMAPLSDAFRYPDESEDGLSADFLLQRFRDYFDECRSLKEKYCDRLEIFTAFETETYVGSSDFVRKMIDALKPDYLVGSVHHVDGICIDFSARLFEEAVSKAGGRARLYQKYFDSQYEMLQDLEPAVVGHFDLIRKYDDEYVNTLSTPEVWQRIERNLDFIAGKNLIVDFNLRGFDKATEQYPSMPVLKSVLEKGIAVVPGDDSHGVNSVGRNFEKGVEVLSTLGANLVWPKPALISYS